MLARARSPTRTCALDVASGNVITTLTDQHRAVEFRSFLNLVNRNVPAHLDVHVIVDNAVDDNVDGVLLVTTPRGRARRTWGASSNAARLTEPRDQRGDRSAHAARSASISMPNDKNAMARRS
jgi:hypothetical protein